MRTRITKTPKVRFPEFEGPWSVKTVEQILAKQSLAVDVQPETQYRQIGVRSHGKGVFHKKPVSGESLGNKRVFWVQPDCLVLNIVFAWEQSLAVTTPNEQGMIASHRFPMFAAKPGECDINFVRRFFLRAKGKHLLGLASPGGAGRNRTLGQTEFAKLKLIIPSLPEQQKIADFLTAVDGRIQQLSQKKALLQDYKKGVMQQLFTQALRFKDDHGNDFPDWEEKKRLGDVTTLIAGFAFGSEFFAADGRKLITPKNFTKSGRASFTEQNTKYTTEDVPERFQCRSGDLLVLLTDLTPTCELLGSPARLRDDDGIVLLNQRIVRLTPDDRQVSAGYLTYFLQTSAYRKRIIETATGSTVRHSSNKILLGTSLPLPSLREQTKIANFLTALDRKIESVSQQITHSQTFKRGLLQQMFV